MTETEIFRQNGEPLPLHGSMRGKFVHELYRAMQTDADIWVVVGDLGYGMFDYIRQDFPDRFINVGAAEQTGVGVCVGLALKGKIPVFYSITPFALFRPFETVRNYMHHDRIPVKLIGSGRGKDYIKDGVSHWAEEDREIMATFPNIICSWPETVEEIPALVDEVLSDGKPHYLNLRR